MAAVRTETRPCRWCGRACAFQVQATITPILDASARRMAGAAAVMKTELVTDQKCVAADRVIAGAFCEPSTISHVRESKRSRGARYKR